MPPDVARHDRSLTVAFDDGTTGRFHYLWLRDNCPQLRHASTHHRVVETSSIPADVHPSQVEVTADAVRITWAHDDHVSVFPIDWLRAHDYSNGAHVERTTITTWNAAMADELPHADYADVLAKPAARSEFLGGFVRYGLAFLHNVSCEPGTVLDVAADFGEIRVTSWGKVFDVISMETANSVAYTSLGLVVHTDEGYRHPAPTVQLQHFLKSETTGGDATLTDGFRVVEDLRRSRPDAFELLATTQLRFHIADATSEHENVGSVIELDGAGNVRQVRFSNHSVQPFLMPFEQMDAYYEAYRLFGAMRESAEYRLQIPMNAGDLYMVDNHRIMHGRTAFSSGGARHLQSCYIERDELVSRLTVLNRLEAPTST
jgi:gamma-butyrobetaine dioxygenase